MITKEQAEFLDKLLPYALLIQEYTYHKASFTTIEESPSGIFPSVVVSEILIQSNWGEHPVCKEDLLFNTAKGVSKRYSNNLAVLPVGKTWKGKSNLYKDVEYRAYKDWQTFAVDYSDYLVFSGIFDTLLKSNEPMTQLDLFSLTKEAPEEYYSNMITIISEAQYYLDGKTKG